MGVVCVPLSTFSARAIVGLGARALVAFGSSAKGVVVTGEIVGMGVGEGA